MQQVQQVKQAQQAQQQQVNYYSQSMSPQFSDAPLQGFNTNGTQPMSMPMNSEMNFNSGSLTSNNFIQQQRQQQQLQQGGGCNVARHVQLTAQKNGQSIKQNEMKGGQLEGGVKPNVVHNKRYIPPQKSDSTWQCGVCTHNNLAQTQKCEICGVVMVEFVCLIVVVMVWYRVLIGDYFVCFDNDYNRVVNHKKAVSKVHQQCHYPLITQFSVVCVYCFCCCFSFFIFFFWFFYNLLNLFCILFFAFYSRNGNLDNNPVWSVDNGDVSYVH